MNNSADSLRNVPVFVQVSSIFMDAGRRMIQEDYALAQRERGIFAVADGFGGAEAGFKAAKTACDSVKSFLEKEAGDEDATMPYVIRPYFSLAGNVLFNAVLYANRNVHRQNKDKGVHERGGASLLTAYLDDDLLAIANVGGCRLSLFRGDRRTELVVPRTYGKFMDPFKTDTTRPGDDVPLMAVGMSEDLEPEIIECRVQAGDWVLLHTDGLGSRELEEILLIKSKQFNTEEVVQAVAEVAKSRTSRDNVAYGLILF